MKLMISQNIDNNRVRLDFRKGPDRPKNLPSYEIASHNADEFVKEYNSQTEKIHKITGGMISATSIVGGLAGIKIYKSAGKHKFLKGISTLAAGVISGAIISASVASDMKNKLMDKYHVRILSSQNDVSACNQ